MAQPINEAIRGVVLAGGTGSRMLPLTRVTNKHLLPIGRKPMIYCPLEKLVEAGLRDILIVTGTEHMGDMIRLLGSGREFGASFTYRVQDEAGGIAQALGLAETFAAGRKIAVILGDNIFQASIGGFAQQFSAQPEGAMILLKKVPDPRRYGVAEVAGGRIVSIVEKPAAPRGDLAVTGIYFYDAEVFNHIRTLKPSKRGELEITDVNNAYLRAGTLAWAELAGYWTDAGTHESWQHANQLVSGAESEG